MIIFRSPTLKTAADLFKGMLGLHGIGWSQLTGSDVFIGRTRVAFSIAVSAFIALLCPNTLQILSRYEPALGWKPIPSAGATAKTSLLWTPSLAWAIATSIIAAIGILYLGGQSEFLYWQF